MKHGLHARQLRHERGPASSSLRTPFALAGVNNIMAYSWPSHCKKYLECLEAEKQFLRRQQVCGCPNGAAGIGTSSMEGVAHSSCFDHPKVTVMVLRLCAFSHGSLLQMQGLEASVSHRMLSSLWQLTGTVSAPCSILHISHPGPACEPADML